MKKIIVLFTILFVAFHAFAQEKISGYVEDSLTHNRLANVSNRPMSMYVWAVTNYIRLI